MCAFRPKKKKNDPEKISALRSDSKKYPRRKISREREREEVRLHVAYPREKMRS